MQIASAVARAEVTALGAELERSLHRVGLALEADIASIALVSADDDSGIGALYQWRAIGWMDPAFAIDASRARWWMRRQALGQEILIDDVDALPAEASYERDLLRARGTRALAAIPCASIDRVFGYVVVEHLRRDTYTWTEDDLDFLATYAEIVASTLEREQTELALLDAKRHAEEANRAKTDFIASMSHELKTPLTAILGFTELLDREFAGPLTERQRQYLTDIRDSAQHLRAIVDDTLDIARIDANRIELSIGEVPLGMILDGAVAQVRDRATDAGQTLTVDRPLVDEAVWADGRKLRQLMLNLLSNAIKFTPRGGTVTVRARFDGPAYEVEVEDTGVGIAAHDHERIFETFARVDAAGRARGIDGCGLGLALVRRLARAHGGDVVVQSELGCGALFRARLPRDARPHAPNKAAFLGGFS